MLSQTWRNRFDDDVLEFVTIAAHFVVKEIHDYGPSVHAVRPKEEITDRDNSLSPASEDDNKAGRGFIDEQIHRTTRLARNHGFTSFNSGRAENATYADTQFFELQTFMARSAVALLKGLLDSSIVEAVTTGYTEILTCVPSNSSLREI